MSIPMTHDHIFNLLLFFRFTYVAPSVLEEMQSLDFRPRSMSRRMPRRPHPSGGGTTPLPHAVSEAMELGGAEAMDTV